MNVILEINKEHKTFSELDAKLLYANIQESPQEIMHKYELDEQGLSFLWFQLVDAFEVVKKKNPITGNITDIIQLKE